MARISNLVSTELDHYDGTHSKRTGNRDGYFYISQ